MKKLSKKSLSLNLDTIRSLTETALAGVAGGATTACPPQSSGSGCYTACADKFIVTRY